LDYHNDHGCFSAPDWECVGSGDPRSTPFDRVETPGPRRPALTEPPLVFPTSEPRLRIKVSDIAWGVFLGLLGWSILAFVGFVALSAFFVSVTP